MAKDSTELDLWAFDEDLELDESPARGAAEADIPAPRKPWTGKPAAEAEDSGEKIPEIPATRGSRVRLNVSKGRVKNQRAGPVAGSLKNDLELEELELWSDDTKQSIPEVDELPGELPALPVEEIQAQKPETPLNGTQDEIAAEVTLPESETEPESEPAPGVTSNGQPAASPSKAPAEPAAMPQAAKLWSLRPIPGLSKSERIGLAALLALLLGLGTTALVLTLGRLPTESSRARAGDFPLRGQFVTVKKVSSYWREPIMDGAAPDTVRRGTRLLPVLEMEINEGSGALRVLFRDDQRLVVGDAVTRSVRDKGKLLIPATAGFEDIGMHAAYRTGQSKPWTIEVFEAASEDAEGRDFKRLFEINISTDRR